MINLGTATPQEAYAYAHGYTDARADLTPDLDALTKECASLRAQLEEARADADYYRTCSDLKPGIVTRLERAINTSTNRSEWRRKYNLDSKEGAA